jgi:hypothetical protein
VNARVDGGTGFLPGYVPFIGVDYFSEQTQGRRILAYAMSQNLRGNENFAVGWAQDFQSGTGVEALDRQNRRYSAPRSRCISIMMYPFDTSHVPILCAIVRHLLDEAKANESSIYSEISATNLSKFSFCTTDHRKTQDCDESFLRCWDWFSRLEIEVLEPDYILCCGKRVSRIVRTKIQEVKDGLRAPVLLDVAFPSLRVINKWYRKQKENEVSSKDECIARIMAMLSQDDLNLRIKCKSPKDVTVKDVIARDIWYFASMHESLRDQLKGTTAV